MTTNYGTPAPKPRPRRVAVISHDIDILLSWVEARGLFPTPPPRSSLPPGMHWDSADGTVYRVIRPFGNICGERFDEFILLDPTWIGPPDAQAWLRDTLLSRYARRTL